MHRFKNKYVIIGAVVIVLVIIIIVKHGGKASPFETAQVALGDVIEQVSVTGTISPISSAALAFEKSGVISKIYVSVGDSIKAGDPVASLDNADDAAALASAQATLSDLSRSLTPTELAVQETNISNAQTDALNAAHDGYAKAQGALVNYTDQFFNNPQSSNPNINIRTSSQITSDSINNERASVTNTLNAWSLELSTASSSDVNTLVSDAAVNLSIVKNFMNDLSTIITNLTPLNAGLPQVQLTADVAAMNSGLSTVNAAIDSVTAAQTELASAQSNYNLALAGNSAQSIAAQAAKVAQAQAILDEDTIISPIDGIITQADPNVGEYMAPGEGGFAVQNSNFEIEAYVPEADIAKVAVGDHASTTLDAYGSDVNFPSTVTMVDPAETVLEGVPTYKVTLLFDSADARIKSGMTANLEILTHEADNVLAVPSRAITDTNGVKTVQIVNPDGITARTVTVTIGLKGSDGTTEITSGLSAGETVVTYVKTS